MTITRIEQAYGLLNVHLRQADLGFKDPVDRIKIEICKAYCYSFAMDTDKPWVDMKPTVQAIIECNNIYHLVYVKGIVDGFKYAR